MKENRVEKIVRSSGRYLKSLAGTVRSLALPYRCMACGAYLKPGRNAEPLAACFCTKCLCLPLPRFSPPFCPCCGCLYPESSADSHLCEACLKLRPEIDRVRAAFSYEGIVRTAVGLFKYNGRLRLARPMEYYLFESFELYFAREGIDLILPIPLHFSRAWERQFNQAVLLVRNFSRLFLQRHGRAPAWKIQLDLLSRRRATLSQTGLDHRERRKNLNNAFAVGPAAGIKGRRVVIIDDVYTSGATCRAAARSLLNAGARSVDALVLARA